MRIADIQEKFLAFVPAEAILVGRSIDNDLHALQMLHRRGASCLEKTCAITLLFCNTW